jgi:DNA polymerase delta subunit 1
MPGATVGPVPVIRMFGITMGGNSVAAHIHGYSPYFFVPAQPNFKTEDCAKFKVCVCE